MANPFNVREMPRSSYLNIYTYKLMFIYTYVCIWSKCEVIHCWQLYEL